MARFTPSPDFDKIVDKAAEPGLERTAERVAAVAQRRTSPVRTGHYQRSLRVVLDERGAVVESTDPFAHLIEFGSINNPVYAPLRNAGAEVGRMEPK